jgi:hypothetical protein
MVFVFNSLKLLKRNDLPEPTGEAEAPDFLNCIQFVKSQSCKGNFSASKLASFDMIFTHKNQQKSILFISFKSKKKMDKSIYGKTCLSSCVSRRNTAK